MSAVLDSSAVLALLFRERGAEAVQDWLGGALMCTVNYSEVAGKLVQLGQSVEQVQSTLARLPIRWQEFTLERSLLAASLQQYNTRGVSLGDRACLALAMQTSLPLITSDQRLAELELELEIHVFR
ncbi:MAG: type II toxin-antitoxin system VapC family toxin [Zavarzinella sp.]